MPGIVPLGYKKDNNKKTVIDETTNYKQQYRNCMGMKNKCFSYFLFYIIEVFGFYQYETYKTLCIAQEKSFILLIGSTIGVVIRFLICLLFANISFALVIFGIVNFIDFYSRSVVYRLVLSKFYKY